MHSFAPFAGHVPSKGMSRDQKASKVFCQNASWREMKVSKIQCLWSTWQDTHVEYLVTISL